MPAMSVPVVDLTSARAGRGIPEAANALRRACVETGLVQVTGHGVPVQVLDRAYAAVAALVSLPPEVKATLRSPTGHQFRGLDTRRDERGEVLMEAFETGVHDDEAAALAAGVPPAVADAFHPNVWPDLPGFRRAWEECGDAFRELGRTLMQLVAVGIGLAQSFFDEVLEADATQLGMNWYPPRPATTGPGPDVVHGAHTDSGVLTVLHQRGDYVGLQVRTRHGGWEAVDLRDEAFVVNVGELMTRWTNGTWPAIEHRVVASDVPGRTRTSLVAFVMPALDTVIAPLGPTIGPSGPAWGPITPYEAQAEYLRTAPHRLPEPGAWQRESVVG